MFFDPPYGVTDRSEDIYHHDSATIAVDVMEWVKIRGENKKYRIILTGYEEYSELVENYGWTSENWKAQGGYANVGKEKSRGKENCKREMIYYSPHCLTSKQQQTLF